MDEAPRFDYPPDMSSTSYTRVRCLAGNWFVTASSALLQDICEPLAGTLSFIVSLHLPTINSFLRIWCSKCLGCPRVPSLHTPVHLLVLQSSWYYKEDDIGSIHYTCFGTNAKIMTASTCNEYYKQHPSQEM